MPSDKAKAGRPRVLVRRHVIEVKEDTREWIESLGENLLNRQTAFPKSRVAGAAITAVGIYMMVELVGVFGKAAARQTPKIAGELLGFIFPGPLTDWFTAILTSTELEKKPIELLERLKSVNYLGLALGTLGGGMVLAGQNPGAVLSGIGDIIDGLIPG